MMKKNIEDSIVSETRPGWLYIFSLILAAATFLLIVAGGLVTSHEAGLAVPDWPLSYGQLMPPMVGNIFWEHGHRMIAGTVGMLTFLFAISVQIFEKRKWMKQFAWAMFGAVFLQALLGGLTVLMLLPPPVSVFHAALAQTFFSMVVLSVYFLNPKFSRAPVEKADPRAKRLFFFTAGFVFLQLLLGATIRHTAGHIHVIITHIVVAGIVLIHVALSVRRIYLDFHGRPGLALAGNALGLLTLSQIFLGVATLVFTRMVERGYSPRYEDILFATAHQSAGALILALILLIATMSAR